MINRNVLKRLEALEARKRNTYVAPKPPPLSLYLIGFFGGHYTPVQSARENYVLAIARREKGDGDDDTWKAAAIRRFEKLSPDEIAARHRAAWERICRRRKIDPATMQPQDAAVRMFKALDNGMQVPDAAWG